jgi:hypothetical protein
MLLGGFTNTSTGQGAIDCPASAPSCFSYGFWALLSESGLVDSEVARVAGAGFCNGAFTTSVYAADGHVIAAGAYTCGELGIQDHRGVVAPDSEPPVPAMFVRRRPL